MIAFILGDDSISEVSPVTLLAGKTLTAVNLAIALSKEVNQTVLLVDLDLKTPSVAATLGLKVDYGQIINLSISKFF